MLCFGTWTAHGHAQNCTFEEENIYIINLSTECTISFATGIHVSLTYLHVWFGTNVVWFLLLLIMTGKCFHLTAYTTVFTGDFIVPRDLSILAWANRSISNTPWLPCEGSHLFWEQIFVLRWSAKSEANIYSWLVKMS